MKKDKVRSERERSKFETDIAESKTRGNRLEERVYNLNKLVDNMNAQVKESKAKVDTFNEERQVDSEGHEKALAEKERKLQEFFIKKLDRKL